MFFLKKIAFNYIQCIRKKCVRSCGENVRIAKNCYLRGNIEIGNNVVIGEGARLVSTIATLRIHDYVVFGPNVTIYTGDHAINTVGKHIIEIKDEDKKYDASQQYDKDVVIEAGCWIGTGAIILKGVTVGRGSVIGAGAIVTKSIPPYSIYTGVPSVKCSRRFTDEQIIEHEKVLTERNLPLF